jgi:hypothetical protein
MSVNVETSCDAVATSAPLDSFDRTTGTMHRVVFELREVDTWYAIMREARMMFGKNWRCQSHVKRRLIRVWAMTGAEQVWFEVPDPQFGTWCALKLAVILATPPINKQCS